MAFYFKDHRFRIAGFMAAGDKDILAYLQRSCFVKTSNGYWLAWHNDTIEKIAVLPPDHPKEFPCEWLHDAKSIKKAVHTVESGQYVRTTDYDAVQVVETMVIPESISRIRASNTKKTERRILAEPYLTHGQQTRLIAGKSIAIVLTDKQKHHLQWRKKVRGELSSDTKKAPSFYLYAVHEDGCLTYQFKVKTISPQWYVHTYIHPTWPHFQKHCKTRSKQIVLGCVINRFDPHRQGGLLAEIHLLADGLTELTVIHEAVHASAYLSRNIDNQEAKAIAAPNVRNAGNILQCREEIQCRTVEFISQQIVMVLHALNIPCVPMRIAEITTAIADV